MYLKLNHVNNDTKLYFIFREIEVEKGFLDLTTQEEQCVVHFFHEDFRRCAIMDTHLQVYCYILGYAN